MPPAEAGRRHAGRLAALHGDQTVCTGPGRAPTVRALPRARLTRVLKRLDKQGLLLVLAPAGYGKTTLLAQLARDAEGPVAWHWTQGEDAASSALLHHLEKELATVMPALPRGWESADAACAALESWMGPPPLLVVDDFHLVQGTAAEGTLERLALRAPIRLAVGTRAVPRFNVSRLRVSGALLELRPDDLCFRQWEVERLFGEVFGEHLPPEDLAALTRRTGGWPAALKLFHLATSGRGLLQTRRALATLGGASKPLREYLARNVVDEIPGALRNFMVRTSVLGRLSPRLCDELLESGASELPLEQLDQRQLVLPVWGDEDGYRYPEILRSHLQAALVDEVGEVAVRELSQKAGTILERAGAASEALDAVCRAEDWAALRALLERHGEQLADNSAAWIDLVPPSIWRKNPWLLLGAARARRAEGSFRAALETYREAEHGFGAARARRVCNGERRALSTWVEPTAEPASDWLGRVRDATISRPMSALKPGGPLPPAERALAEGLRYLLAGDIRSAGALLRRVPEEPGVCPALAGVANTARAVTLLLCGDSAGATQAELAAEGADSLGLAWLARLSRASLAFRGRADDLSECRSARSAFEHQGDEWGTALATLMEGWGTLTAGADAAGLLGSAMDSFRRLHADVLETWALAALALALARTGRREARETAVRAQVHARALGIPGAQALACSALAIADPAKSSRHRALALALHEELALALAAAPGYHLREPPPSVVVQCFGGFRITIHGTPVDLGLVRPRARQMLRLLALHADRPVHREVLTDALWPDGDMESGSRSLHVAISSLRGVLDPRLERPGSSIIARDGEAYRLALPPDARIDLLDFDRAVAQGRLARSRGENGQSLAAYRSALELHHDELLPEDGPSEWLVRERHRRSAEACEAARAIADLLLQDGDAAGAAEACERGLQVDRYQDELWRLRIESCEQAGEPAAATLARREYVRVLSELGLSTTAAEPHGQGGDQADDRQHEQKQAGALQVMREVRVVPLGGGGR